MLRLGIAIQETWGFFNEIYADLMSIIKQLFFNEGVGICQYFTPELTDIFITMICAPSCKIMMSSFLNGPVVF